MSLDDLRALAHDLNKRLSEAANLSDKLAVGLQNYQPISDPQPDPQPSTVKIRFAQHKYANNTPTDLSVFDVYDLQRGWQASKPLKAGGELYIYTTVVRRVSDPDGLTQFLRPSAVPDAWCAHTPNGGLVTRDRGDGPEQLINIAVKDWRAQAIPKIVAEVVLYDATGLYLDEVDAWWKYAWPMIATSGAKEFTTERYWRSLWLELLGQLADALHARGKKLWVNLGADYSITDQWQKYVVDIVDAVNIEFYTGREGVGAQPTTMNDGWWSQGNFVAAVEQAGKPVHVHSSSLNQQVTDYAFCSWLLHTEFLGSFSASRDYGGQISIPSRRADAERLGRPLGKREQTDSGYRRRFEGGLVTVDPTARTGQVGVPL